MKKTILLFLSLFLFHYSYSQNIQNGYVKSKGVLSERGQLIKGERIYGAIIKPNNSNATLSKTGGRFSFSIVGNEFSIKNVEKAGFVLLDPEFTDRTFRISPDSLVIVLQSKALLEAEQATIERRIRRSLNARFVAMENEIEQLREDNKFTKEDYQRALTDLNNYQSKNEFLIHEMAEKYIRIDFDLVDDTQRQIAICIQTGELTKADSLLNSKGSMEERSNEIDRLGNANKRERAELRKREKDLEQSEKMMEHLVAEFAEDCISRYHISLFKHQLDSAAYWLNLRLNKDPNNIQWLLDVGMFYREYVADYKKGKEFIKKAVSLAEKNNGSRRDSCILATCYNEMGLLLYYDGNDQGAYSEYLKAMELVAPIREEYPLVFADVLLNFDRTQLSSIWGSGYYNQDDIESLQEGINELDIVVNYYQKGGNKYKEATALILIGDIFCEVMEPETALEAYNKALSILDGTGDSVALSELYEKIGNCLTAKQDYLSASNYFQKSIDILQRIFGRDNPQAIPRYLSFGTLRQGENKLSEARALYDKALSLCQTFYPDTNKDWMNTYLKLGELCLAMEQYESSLDYYNKALPILAATGSRHMSDVLFPISHAYYGMHDYVAAYAYYEGGIEDIEEHSSVGIENLTSHYSTLYSILMRDIVPLKNAFEKMMLDKAVYATVIEGDNPARKKGLEGEYAILEFCDWTLDSPINIFDEVSYNQGKPKRIVLLKNGVISTHEFDDNIGIFINIHKVGKKNKRAINNAYYSWLSKTGRPVKSNDLATYIYDAFTTYERLFVSFPQEYKNEYDDFYSHILEHLSAEVAEQKRDKEVLISFRERNIRTYSIANDANNGGFALELASAYADLGTSYSYLDMNMSKRDSLYQQALSLCELYYKNNPGKKECLDIKFNILINLSFANS